MEKPPVYTEDKTYQENVVGHPTIETLVNTGRRLWNMNENEMADQVERITMSMHRKKGSQSRQTSMRVPGQIDWFISEAIPELFPGLVGFSERLNIVSMIGCLVLAEKFGDRLRQGGKTPRNRFQAFRDEVTHVTDTVYDAQDVVCSVKNLLNAIEAVKTNINQMNAIDSSLTQVISHIPEDVWKIASEQLSTDRRFAAYTSRQAERIRKQQNYEEQLFIVQ